MKTKILSVTVNVFFLVVAFLLSGSSAQGSNLLKIAVFPFDIHSEQNHTALQLEIGETIKTELMKAPTVQIVPLETHVKLSEEGHINENSALQIGRKINADFVVIGTLSQLGKSYSMDAKLIDMKSGAASQGIFVQGTTVEGIKNLAARLADKVASQISVEEKIASISITGNQKIEAGAILNVIKESRGKRFSPSDLSDDIKTIYKMGYFSDVKAEVKDSPEGKIITFTVQEKPIVASFSIKGNKAIDTKDIEAVVTVKPKQFLDEEKIVADLDKIMTLYSNKGYFNTEVKYDIDKKSERDIRLTYTITEGKILYIKSITFTGNQAYSSKTLKGMMYTKEYGFFHFLTESGVLKEDKLTEDIKKLNTFYLNNGYVSAKVGDPEITRDKGGIYVKIAVTEGKRYLVGKVDVTGDTISIPPETLASKLQIKKKEFYDREAIMKDLDYLNQAYNDEGYAYVDVTPITVPDEKEQKVNIHYQVNKGEQIYINKITVTGNTKTRDKVIRRQVPVVEGDLFSRSKLKASYAGLNRLRYFEEVDFQTERGPEKNLMDVNIRVKEKPTGMFSIGAGYSAYDNFIFSCQTSQQNLFGRGQTLGVTASIGGSSQYYDLYFIEPALFDTPLYSKSDLWNTSREYDTYTFKSEGFGQTFGYPLWPRWTGYVGYRLSNDRIDDVWSTASSIIQRQAGSYTTSGLTFSLGRDTTDDNFFPTRGSKQNASIEFTGGPLQGNVDYTKYTAGSVWYYPLPWWDTVFSIRGRIGYLQERGDKELPVYTHFYLGGINSIRGLRDVGPRDPETGDYLGGFTMLNFNVEYLFNIIKSAGMKGVLFFDTGNTWNSGFHFNDMRRTAGVGMRWYSPIGPIRLEYGWVLDRKDDDPTGRFEFTMGMFM